MRVVDDFDEDDISISTKSLPYLPSMTHGFDPFTKMGQIHVLWMDVMVSMQHLRIYSWVADQMK